MGESMTLSALELSFELGESPRPYGRCRSARSGCGTCIIKSEGRAAGRQTQERLSSAPHIGGHPTSECENAVLEMVRCVCQREVLTAAWCIETLERGVVMSRGRTLERTLPRRCMQHGPNRSQDAAGTARSA